MKMAKIRCDAALPDDDILCCVTSIVNYPTAATVIKVLYLIVYASRTLNSLLFFDFH